MPTRNLTRVFSTVAACLALAGSTALVAAPKNDQADKESAKQLEAKRPKVTLRAQPPVGRTWLPPVA